MIREALWRTDYWELSQIGIKFLAESHQARLTWDQEAAKAYFWEILADPDAGMFVAEVEHPDKVTLAGYGVVRIRREVTVESIAYLTSYYVLPEYRGEFHGWRLLKACQNYAIERGAAYLYASSTAGLNDDGQAIASFRRLFEKAGMTYLGDMFVQELPDG